MPRQNRQYTDDNMFTARCNETGVRVMKLIGNNRGLIGRVYGLPGAIKRACFLTYTANPTQDVYQYGI